MNYRSLSVGRLPPDEFLRMDDICKRFQSQWISGPRPRIEEFIIAPDAVEYKVLLKELILLEAELRIREGEQPRAADYSGRFPNVEAAWVQEILETLGPVDATAPTATGPGAIVPLKRA